MTDHTTHDLALARAERDAWQTTCEELHTEIARLTVEAETYRRDIDAERACRRTIDATLAHEREAGRGLQAQAEAMRAERVRLATMKDSLCPVTLPSPDRAEDLIRSILSERRALMRGLGATLDDKLSDAWAAEWIDATRTALAKLSPAPAREAAPTLVAVSDEELRDAYLNDPDDTLSGIRAVRAKLGAAEVTEERLAAAIREAYGHAAPEFVRAALNYLRATAAKGG